ncbi:MULTISPECIES: fimbrial biogenesis chaperone [Proteus]|uniref:fimbrial biogenesis chaperone n=1 Tax=Proteus TaxID=583 RepID=UPI000D6DFE68|nr:MULTISPECIES: molecular chaperone [Proteus]NBM12189.1 fimbria/pilus periplasmic chaperone [Proteus sp. G2670]NBM31083.1 fimbria/pilus periplasmic chaperone [Proteus sp. G2664]NBM67126.1 fimbria/pilus periplasmic chaperone [Proteus sp. G2663]NBM84933.1 fimbria/pilus periplasmic chaperone [Proteus sp. G2661]NBM94088.1 fimbria/pilus periplasmic chaperone [Proteus sp. G2662]
MKKILLIKCIIYLFISSFSLYTIAGVSLKQTRVIFKATDKSKSVVIYNNSPNLYLAQSQINLTLNNQQIDNSFIIIPPLVRVEPNLSSTVKILPQSLSHLPKDKESVFFIAIQLIPESKKINSQEKSEINTEITVVTRFVIKLFYRPESLLEKSSSDFADKLSFSLVNNKLVIKNPSPYFMSLSQLKLNGVLYSSPIPVMVPPLSEIALDNNEKVKDVSWQIIDDFGGYSSVYSQSLIEKNNR